MQKWDQENEGSHHRMDKIRGDDFLSDKYQIDTIQEVKDMPINITQPQTKNLYICVRLGVRFATGRTIVGF